jgi:hypothetical protein
MQNEIRETFDKPIPHQIWQPLFLYYIDLSFISEQDYYFTITTVNDATNGESSHSIQIMCRTKAGCKLIIYYIILIRRTQACVS